MHYCRDLVQQSQSMQLVKLLRDTRGFGATDPRDQVFAILSLATLSPEPLPATEVIQTNYERTPTEVFLETTWALIENSDDLAFLIDVEDMWYRNIADLPSWVPDFSTLERPKIYFQSTAFSTDKGLKVSLNHPPDRRLFGTAAYQLGEIDDATYLGYDEPFISYFSKTITLICNLAPVYILNEDRLDVLWRTMIQNGVDWISPAAAEVAYDFRNWILLSITTAAIEARTSGSGEEQVNDLITQLHTYSLTDQTGLMPSQQDMEDVIKQRQDGQQFEYENSASKYVLELGFYETMRLFKTDDGLLGQGSWSLQTGDSLWIIPGVCVPMVLRSTDTEDHFKVIGPAYVHGILDGEALEGGRLQQRSIVLE